MSGLHGRNARSHVETVKNIVGEHVLVMDVGNIMRTKTEIAILKTVLVDGQAGVDAPFLAVKDIKLAHDRVMEIIAKNI